MAQAAYRTKVKMAGTPTEFLAAKMTRRSASVFQITDVNKRVWLSDFPVYITERDTGAPIGQSGDGSFDIDYMTGTITFPGDTEVGTQYNVDAWYVPIKDIAGAMEYSVELGGEMLNNTSFDKTNVNGGFNTMQQGLIDASISIGRFYDVAGEFKTLVQNRTPVMIEINPGGGSELISGWFVIESAGSEGDVAGLEKEMVSLQLGGQAKTHFSWTD